MSGQAAERVAEWICGRAKAYGMWLESLPSWLGLPVSIALIIPALALYYIGLAVLIGLYVFGCPDEAGL